MEIRTRALSARTSGCGDIRDRTAPVAAPARRECLRG